MPSSPRHAPARPSTLATQTSCSEQYPETSSFPSNRFLPQGRTRGCAGKGEHPPGDPENGGKCKEKETGNIQRTLYPQFGKTPGLSHLQPPGVYQSLGSTDSPRTRSLGGAGGGAAGCSWVSNKQRVFQGSLSPSLNHIWVSFLQLTHPLRCILLRWISHTARFKGKKTFRHIIIPYLKTNTFLSKKELHGGTTSQTVEMLHLLKTSY